jgi:hypothetical protein
MKKSASKKLQLGKISVASLSNAAQSLVKGGMAQKSSQCDSNPIPCLSQGAGTACSWDICRF